MVLLIKKWNGYETLKEFVEYNDEGQPDAVHYSAMTALLVKAIKEQQIIIENQTTNETHRIPMTNYENHENHKISYENH